MVHATLDGLLRCLHVRLPILLPSLPLPHPQEKEKTRTTVEDVRTVCDAEMRGLKERLRERDADIEECRRRVAAMKEAGEGVRECMRTSML